MEVSKRNISTRIFFSKNIHMAEYTEAQLLTSNLLDWEQPTFVFRLCSEFLRQQHCNSFSYQTTKRMWSIPKFFFSCKASEMDVSDLARDILVGANKKLNSVWPRDCHKKLWKDTKSWDHLSFFRSTSVQEYDSTTKGGESFKKRSLISRHSCLFFSRRKFTLPANFHVINWPLVLCVGWLFHPSH